MPIQFVVFKYRATTNGGNACESRLCTKKRRSIRSSFIVVVQCFKDGVELEMAHDTPYMHASVIEGVNTARSAFHAKASKMSTMLGSTWGIMPLVCYCVAIAD